MKLIPLILTHKLVSLGDQDVDVPVHLYTNRLEGDINLNGLQDVKIIEENGKSKAIFTMNYVDIRISFLKRHKKMFDGWVGDCYDQTDHVPKNAKKNLVFEGLFDRVECFGSYISSFELNKSQENISISCEKMCYVVELQVLSKRVKQAIESRL